MSGFLLEDDLGFDMKTLAEAEAAARLGMVLWVPTVANAALGGMFLDAMFVGLKKAGVSLRGIPLFLS